MTRTIDASPTVGRRAAVIARVLVLVLAASGCGGDDCTSPCFGGATDGGGIRGHDDAGPVGGGDASSGLDAGAPPPDLESREGFADAAQCFDGIDNDGYAGVDCDNEFCRERAVCCVGVADPGCCRAVLPGAALADLGECGVGPASSCEALTTSGAVLFGDAMPSIGADHSLIPNGGERSDSGAVLLGAVRPRSGIVTLRARIAAPRRCDGCIDAVGVSLAPESAIGTHVRGVVGILVSGSRGDVSVLVGGAIAWSHDLPDDGEHTYQLTVDPSGTVDFHMDAPETLSARVEAALPDEPLRVVVHGRTSNRGAIDTPPARVLWATATVVGCDMPSALAPQPAPLVTPVLPVWPEDGASAPSIARPPGLGPEATRMAFAAGRAIWMASPDGAGGFVVTSATPALPLGNWAPGGVGDPELVALEDRWLLLFTATDGHGARRIARIEGPAGFGETFDPMLVSDLMTLPADDDAGRIVELDGASAAMIDGALWVAARAVRESGESSLVLLRPGIDASADFVLDGVCGTGCESLDEPSASVVHRAGERGDGAFDADEVASPALVSHGGVHRLYYSGRRGTRWSIGLLVTFDMRFFREGNGGAPILAASGAGDDALGVRDPEPWTEAGTLTLFHTGTDGVSTHVMAASQPIAAP